MAKKFQQTVSNAYLAQAAGNRLASEAGDSLVRVPVEKIVPNPFQPRRRFQATEIEGLAESIRIHGILEPLVGRPETDGTYTLIAGHRRFEAARHAGLKHVPVVVRKTGDDALLVEALVENIQRRDLHPIDEARALGDLLAKLGTQEKTAAALGMNRSTVAHALRLLNLGEEILEICSQIADLSRLGAARLVRVPETLRLAEARRMLEKSLRAESSDAETPPRQTKLRESPKPNVYVYAGKTGSKGSPFQIEVRYKRKRNIELEEIEAALEQALAEIRRSKQIVGTPTIP